MVAAVMTYTSLKADVLNYSERANDDALIAQYDSLLALAENRIAVDCKTLGSQLPLTGVLTIQSPSQDKPAFWRKTTSLHIILPTGKWKPLFVRTLEFCREFWPNPTLTDEPLYYADYDYNHWLISPTPQLSYPLRVVYDARIEPLSVEGQENWLTQYAPHVLLRAVMLEVQAYLKNEEMTTYWTGEYQTAVAGLTGEDQSRAVDRAS